jgi:hypothetical protein
MTPSKPMLFVSHVSEDRAVAMQVVAELEPRGIRCWIAPRDVRPGRPFDDEIAEAIETSVAMLLIFSERCNYNEYILREVTVASDNQKLIIPFRIEDAPPRKGLAVRLSNLHWIDGFMDRGLAVEELTQALSPSSDREQGSEQNKRKKQLEQEEQQRQRSYMGKYLSSIPTYTPVLTTRR